jgi:hypothetical protein
MGVAALIGVIVAREFGRTDETDGFFAAYGVFVVLAIASLAIRVAVLPSLSRARDAGRLGGELAGFGLAAASIGLPLLIVLQLAAPALSSVLTGGDSPVAESACADALRWMVPAAVLQVFAGLAASGLAALDDYGTAAAGYAAGSLAGLALVLARVEPDGIIVVSYAMAVNALVALLVPTVGLAVQARARGVPSAAARPAGASFGTRLTTFGVATAFVLCIQALYLVCLPFAGALGTGELSSFSYAYIGASALVSVTALPLGLVSAVPLTRAGLGPAGVARLVDSGAWVSLVVIGAVSGVVIVVGEDVIGGVLGDAYGGDIGAEIGRLIALLGPWTVASVGLTLSFPLAFVSERARRLPLLGVAAVAAQLALVWAGAALFDLAGLAVALAVSTWLLLALLLRELGALGPALRGLAFPALAVASLTISAFVPPALLLGPLAATLVGLGLYTALLAALRPAGLARAWGYLRTLA